MEKFNDDLYNEAQFKNRPKQTYYAYAQTVWEVLQPNSVLDLGCANGYALDWWQKQGITIKGIEPAKAAYKFMPLSVRGKVKQLDLRKKLTLKKFDLVNCSEVGEHIEAKYEPILFTNILQAVKNFLVISWSPETNIEHVNPRPLSYVKKKLINLGLFFEPELTQNLTAKLKTIKTYPHWHKNILVFSRTPQAKRILIRHYEWLPSYINKNIGYFAQTAVKLGFGPRWAPNHWNSLLKRWHRVWLYPYEKRLLVKLLLLKLRGNKTIIKMDSIIIQPWRAKLVSWLAFKVLVESKAVARPFGQAKNLQWFSGGLSQKNIDLIKKLKVNRRKQILFCGRPTYQKGIDRFKKIRIPGWKLKIASGLSGKEYYQEILKSAVVVLPTRGEGWPNVFSDAFFCRRLFLTTTEAKCGEVILNTDFYVTDFQKGLKKVVNNLDWYYKNYNRLYDSSKFVIADKAFLSLIINQG